MQGTAVVGGDEPEVEPGDRLIFQMNFYYPKELKSDDRQLKAARVDTDKTSTFPGAAANDPEVIAPLDPDAFDPMSKSVVADVRAVG